MTVREKIEGSDSKDRWDFDKKKLFEQTNYMSKICENLFEVAQTLDQFYKFLGPELKAVTGDSAGIDEVRFQYFPHCFLEDTSFVLANPC